ncbi:ArsC family reductase [Ideonella paludis]|uniref:ArsC family reductase n=1 Tax=Ideonella paludis TaxID=1233411 RepID=A0ABS5DRV3_9BURK|nr:ArsC family reductase [Ideonella paludis]MBQ0933855.1 ArsC family reductase [Ideonella paludis]
MTTLYGIPNCDTVKKARAFLTEQGHAHSFHDFKKAGVPAERLPAWVAAVGWEKLLNRQGTTWRKLPPEVQARVVDADSAMALMQEQPSVIKRPVVEWPQGQVSVGFTPALFADLLSAA